MECGAEFYYQIGHAYIAVLMNNVHLLTTVAKIIGILIFFGHKIRQDKKFIILSVKGLTWPISLTSHSMLYWFILYEMQN